MIAWQLFPLNKIAIFGKSFWVVGWEVTEYSDRAFCFRFHIRVYLSLPETDPGVMVSIENFISQIYIQDLASLLYKPSVPSGPITTPHLSSKYMTEWFKFKSFLVRSMLTPTSQTSKIPKKQAALIAYLKSRPLRPLVPAVFPRLISKLCLEVSVKVSSSDVMGNPSEAAPVDKITIAKSAGQAGTYVEPMEQTFLKEEVSHMIDAAVSSITYAFATQIATLKAELLESVGTSQPSGGRGLFLALLILNPPLMP